MTTPELYVKLANEVKRRIEVAEAANQGPWLVYQQVTDSTLHAYALGVDGFILEKHSAGTSADVEHVCTFSPEEVLPILRSDLDLIDYHKPWDDGLGTLCVGCSQLSGEGQGWPCRTIKNRFEAYRVKAVA